MSLVHGLEPINALDGVIDVSSWSVHEEFEVHPVGSKPKRTLVCPTAPPHPMLIPNHLYLFKLAEGWKAQQLWSEALAFQIGCAVGVQVPPCFAGANALTGEVGALVEFFYGYPQEVPPLRLIHGADLLQERGLSLGADRPHNLVTNVQLCEDRGLPAAPEWWARAIGFDSLIGNTDRHTENWGLLVDAGGGEAFAPVFDNGTSLAFQQIEENIPNLLRPARMSRYIDQGTHHLGWNPGRDSRTPHLQLCEQYAASDENAGAALRNVIQADLSGIEAAVEACVCLAIEPRFTASRADLVLRLLEQRQARLREVCGG